MSDLETMIDILTRSSVNFVLEHNFDEFTIYIYSIRGDEVPIQFDPNGEVKE